MKRLPAAALFLFFTVLTAAASSSWQTVSFDGNDFTKGEGNGAIQVRDGYIPVPGTSLQREDPLPEGTGAVAVFCFQGRSGGKLRRQGGGVPMAGVPVTFVAPSLTLAARSDASGYVVLALPPGNYEVRGAAALRRIIVERGRTAVAALRSGKRMVD